MKIHSFTTPFIGFNFTISSLGFLLFINVNLITAHGVYANTASLVMNQSNIGLYLKENGIALFIFTTHSSGEYRIETKQNEDELDTVLALANASHPNRFIAYDDDSGIGSYSKILIHLQGNTKYVLFICEFRNKGGRFTIELFQENEGPVSTPTPKAVLIPTPTPSPNVMENLGSPIIRVEPTALNFRLHSSVTEMKLNQYTGKKNRQSNSPVIHFKNALPESVNRISPKQLPALQHNPNARLHYLVQFHKQLSNTERMMLQDKGFNFLGYIPENAYWISTRPNTLHSHQSMFLRIHPSSEINKCDPVLLNNELPNYLLTDNQNLKVSLSIFSDVAHFSYEKLWVEKGIDIVGITDSRTIEIEIDPAQLEFINRLDEVE